MVSWEGIVQGEPGSSTDERPGRHRTGHRRVGRQWGQAQDSGTGAALAQTDTDPSPLPAGSPAQSTETDEAEPGAYVHKLYLILSLSLGLILCIFMPLFNESDGQYHYVNASNIVGLTNDITQYGENSPNWTGTAGVKDALQKGDYFQRYYLQQVHLTSMDLLPRSSTLPSLLSYDYLGHLIPAVGVWLGYHIYPSMGVMILTARIFQTLLTSLVMFVIIKRLRYGKLAFAAVMLSPTAMNQMVSTSYDTTSYLFVAAIAALAINTVARGSFTRKTIVAMAGLSALAFFPMKTDYLLLLLLFPLVVLGLWVHTSLWPRLQVWWARVGRPERVGAVSVSLGILAVVGLAIAVVAHLLTRAYGGLAPVLGKIGINFAFYWGDGVSASRNLTQVFAAPRGSASGVPVWVTGVWVILVALTLLVDKKFVRSPLIAFGALAIFVLHILALYYGFYDSASDLSARGQVLGQIAAVQGRYYTPTVLLLPLFLGWKRLKLRLNGHAYNTVAVIMSVVVVLSNALLLFDMFFSLYMM